jgi:V/A-type H+/Na+-transporting ATPase subunit F
MNSLVFLTPADARPGFTLAGAHQQTVSGGEAATVLQQLLADPDPQVVVVDERLLADIGETRFRELAQRWRGILIVLPAPGAGARLEEDYALRLIRRAIGYQVRLQT